MLKVGDEVYIKGIIKEVDTTETLMPYKVSVDGDEGMWYSGREIVYRDYLTLANHAKALQENCEKYYTCELLYGIPRNWELEKSEESNELTNDEIEFLESYRKLKRKWAKGE